MADWKVVLGHHMIYSAGGHGTNSYLLQDLDPILRENGVQMYLNGHDHNQQLFQYKGMNYVVCGSGGKSSSSRSTRYPSGSLRFFRSDYGFCGLRFCDGQSARLTTYREDGSKSRQDTLSSRSSSLSSADAEQELKSLPSTTCNGTHLYDVQNICSPDGCTVLAGGLAGRTCQDYCRSQGLGCARGWYDDDDSPLDGNCRPKAEVGCDTVRGSELICKCVPV